MLELEVKKQGFTKAQLLKPDWIELSYKKFGLHAVDDMYSAIGFGGLTPNQIVNKIKEEYRKTIKPEETEEEVLESRVSKTQRRPNSNANGIFVKGVDNVLVRFSKCCNPVPGDEIIGYITKGRGVSVHRKDCTNASGLMNEQERLIEVGWNETSKSSYKVDLEIRSIDRKGLLADITAIVDDSRINIVTFSSRTTKDKMCIVNLVLEIDDIEQMNRVIKKMHRIQGVTDVYRK